MNAKRRAVATFLADAQATFNGRPKIPESEAVTLRDYGTVQNGASGLTVLVVGRRDAVTFDPQLVFKPSGPRPEDVVLSPAHFPRVVELMREAQRDLLELDGFLVGGRQGASVHPRASPVTPSQRRGQGT